MPVLLTPAFFMKIPVRFREPNYTLHLSGFGNLSGVL